MKMYEVLKESLSTEGLIEGLFFSVFESDSCPCWSHWAAPHHI